MRPLSSMGAPTVTSPRRWFARPQMWDATPITINVPPDSRPGRPPPPWNPGSPPPADRRNSPRSMTYSRSAKDGTCEIHDVSPRAYPGFSRLWPCNILPTCQRINISLRHRQPLRSASKRNGAAAVEPSQSRCHLRCWARIGARQLGTPLAQARSESHEASIID